MNRIIDALADRLAAAFIKAVEPRLQALLDQQFQLAEHKLKKLLDRQFEAAEERALKVVQSITAPAGIPADAWTGLFRRKA